MKLLDHKELALAVDPRVITSFEAAIAEPPPPADGEDSEQTEEPGDEDGEQTQTPPGRSR